MSKITEALQKAAKEREKQLQQEKEKRDASYSEKLPSEMPGEKTQPSPRAPAPLPTSTGIDPHLITYYEPHSSASEQYRLIRTNIQSMNLKTPPRVLAISSSTYGRERLSPRLI